MKTYTPEELKEILAKHALWLADNTKGARANLRSAYLQYANLRSADLGGADLRGADLRGANLRSADLRGADLQYADLEKADLQYADLEKADLQYADLYNAYLRSANLRSADLRGAKLPYGETWEQYLKEVVPSLLAAGGKDVAQVVAEGWECHTWENCPMACAFGVKSPDQTPILLRPRVTEFVQFFDAGLIPKPVT